ncbi:hypothetical protein C2W55_15505 [Escherichia coli]|nr:hypothetical protein C2W55_15505 [Escherichia coli]
MLGKQSVNEKILQRRVICVSGMFFCIHKMNALYVEKVIISFLDCHVHFLSYEYASFISLNKRFGDMDDNVSG